MDHVSTKDRAEFGPFDSEEVSIPENYRDFGALLIPATLPNVVLRIEVEESTDRGIALTLETETSSLQLSLYSAPKSAEIWPEVMEQLETGLIAQGASVQREVHAFGLSLRVEQLAEGVSRLRRFVGVDGPRWFLRGVLAGTAVDDLSESAFLESIMRSAIVRRGDDPMPPRELIALTLPPGTVPPPRSV